MRDAASQLRFHFISALQTGLEVIGFLSASSYQAASEINSVTTDYAGRGINKTADVLSVHAEGFVPELNVDWRQSVQDFIFGGSRVLQHAVCNVSAGIKKALGLLNNMTVSSVTASLEVVKIMDESLEAVLKKSEGELYGGADGDVAYQPEEPMQISIVEAACAVLHVLKPFSSVSPLDIARAFMTLSLVQREVNAGLPPKPLCLLDFRLSQNTELFDELGYCCKIACAAYSRRLLVLWKMRINSEELEDGIHTVLALPHESVILAHESAELCKPAYYVILDHDKKCICLSIRGSTEISDLLTDLYCRVDPMSQTHTGMQNSAEWVVSKVTCTVQRLTVQYSTYTLFVVGHSLGGGTASLVIREWLRDPELRDWIKGLGMRLRGYSFGPPCVVATSEDTSLKRYITSVVYGYDIVSRVSWGSAENLNRMILHLIENSKAESCICSLDPSCVATHNETALANTSCTGRVGTDSLQRSITCPVFQRQKHQPSVGDSEQICCLAGSCDSTTAIHEDQFQGDICPDVNETLRTLSLESLMRLVGELQLSTLGSLEQQRCRHRLRCAWEALQLTYSEDNVLVPAGRFLIILGSQELKRTGITVQEHWLTPCGGRHVIAEVDLSSAKSSMTQIILHQDALADHIPRSLAAALAVTFGPVNRTSNTTSLQPRETRGEGNIVRFAVSKSQT